MTQTAQKTGQEGTPVGATPPEPASTGSASTPPAGTEPAGTPPEGTLLIVREPFRDFARGHLLAGGEAETILASDHGHHCVVLRRASVPAESDTSAG